MACTKHGVTKVGQEAYIVQLLTTLHVLLGVVKDFIATCVDSIINVSIFWDVPKLCENVKTRLVNGQSSILNYERILMEHLWPTLIKETKRYKKELNKGSFGHY